MNQLPTTAQVKQGARQLFSVATDKAKLVSANVQRGDTSGLDVAVIKATTSQFHVPPKEKHVRTLKGAVHPQQGFHSTYVIRELVKRLHQATDWLLLKYSDSEKLARHQQQGSHILNMDNFIDTTNIEGRFEFSEYVRGYGKYLDEQLEVYARINFYMSPESTVEESRLRSLNGKDLLFQLPVLQHLLTSLVSCKPNNVASRDDVVQASLLMVVKEGLGLYKVISEGIINVSDKFFDMEYLDAVKGLEIYKQAVSDFGNLQGFLRHIEQIDGLKGLWQFPQLRPIPSDFVDEMEAYIKEAPRALDGDAKKKSPPLRKGKVGTKSRSTREPVAFPAVSPDPGMIGPFSKAEPSPAAASPDLLDLEALSFSEPAEAVPALQSNGVNLLNDLEPQFAASGAAHSFGSASLTTAAPSVSQSSMLRGAENGGTGLGGAFNHQQLTSAPSPAGFQRNGTPGNIPVSSSSNPFGNSNPVTPNHAVGGVPAVPFSPMPPPQPLVFPLSPAAAQPVSTPVGISSARPPLGAAPLKKDNALDDPFASLLPQKASRPQLSLKQMSPASSTKSSPGFAPVTPAPAATPSSGLGLSPAGLAQGPPGTSAFSSAPPSPSVGLQQPFATIFEQPAAAQTPTPAGYANGFQTSFEPHGTSSLI